VQKIKFEKFKNHDFEEYFKLVSNEQVMAQITERAIPLKEAQVDFKKLLARNEKHDLFGSYKVFDEMSGEFIGAFSIE